MTLCNSSSIFDRLLWSIYNLIRLRQLRIAPVFIIELSCEEKSFVPIFAMGTYLNLQFRRYLFLRSFHAFTAKIKLSLSIDML